jgi:hypothetical protein
LIPVHSTAQGKEAASMMSFVVVHARGASCAPQFGATDSLVPQGGATAP